jgi:UDP-galactopyranose mutase
VSYENIDLLVVGAGAVGCVVAERAASQLGWRCTILEKRDHIAGNCYDFLDENGLLVPQYAPHYLKTKNKEVINYLSPFTAFIPANFSQEVEYDNELFSIPITLNTLQDFFKLENLSIEAAEKLLQQIRKPIIAPKNAEEFLLSEVGQELYDAFYLNTLKKQYGVHPSELAVSAVATPLVQLTPSTAIELMPIDGYSRMFSRMLSNPLIEVELETDYLKIKELAKPAKATFYTGFIESYFNFKQGDLPWQHAKYFQQIEKNSATALSATSVLDTNPDSDLIFRAENKQLTRQKSEFTSITHGEIHPKGVPYFPIHTPENLAVYERYRQTAEHETFINKVYFGGSLAQYTRLSFAESINRALTIFERIKTDFS